MEIPRIGDESELQLPAYAIDIATWGLSCVCDLHHSSWQHWILHPLSEARDQIQGSFGLSHSCVNTGSLTHCAQVRD